MIGWMRFDISLLNLRPPSAGPPDGSELLQIARDDMWIKVDAFSAFDRTPVGEFYCSRQSATVAPNINLSRGESWENARPINRRKHVSP